MKRALTSEEIQDILDSMHTMHPDPNFTDKSGINGTIDIDPSHNFVIEHSRHHIKKQLQSIEIYPEAISSLKDEILRQYGMSFITPGEMVGCIAATSIGQDYTQESLNSFHSSGQRKENLSSGLPRFQELINLSKEMKTPSVDIEFHPKYYTQLNKDNPDSLRFVRELIDTQIVHVRMNDLILNWSIEKNPRREWWYSSFSLLYSDIHRRCTHRLRLQLNAEKMWKCKKDMGTIAAKLEKNVKLKGLMHVAFSDNYTAQLDIWVDERQLFGCEDALVSRDLDKEDIEKMLRHITEENKAEICLRNVVLPHVRQTTISGVSGVTKCYHSEFGHKTIYTADTRGGSLADILALDCVDPSKCRSNNVHEVMTLFGIEAAYQFLIDEFRKANTKSQVSLRHLKIMVEWMCASGRLMSVNRHGQEISKIGPIAKASFEQPLDAFIKAASTAQLEVISGVSSSIATGNLPKIGTGSFQMLLDVQKLLETKFEEAISTSIEEEEFEPIEQAEITEDMFEDTLGTEDPNYLYHTLDEEEIF
jgi:DNA-directed RNA polymerase II subunit RPB1